MISHYVGTEIKNFDVLVNILNAFVGGTSYNGEGTFNHIDNNTGATLEYPWNVSVDFTTQGTGDFIAFVSGDTHRDRISLVSGFRSIECLNASLAKDQTSSPVKTNLTETETAWDVITIDRVAKTINMTRFGAGEDRSTTY